VLTKLELFKQDFLVSENVSDLNTHLKAFFANVELALAHPDFSSKRLIYSLHKYCEISLSAGPVTDLPSIMFKLVLPSMLEEA
jgi:hypothetical protein